MNDDTPFGLAHLFAQSDATGRALLALLLLMSIASWTLIALKTLARWQRSRRGAAFAARFWNARSLDEARRDLAATPADEPLARLATQALQAQAHHARHGATRLAEAGTCSDHVARTLRQGLDDEATRLDDGLTTLATIGATAPFVGLFGTVWGVYHALVAIGVSGSGTLDRVAGPVGEALIMTGLGLAVAIPAVVAYNAFVRSNRLASARHDAFAFELHNFLTLGPSPVAGSPSAVPAGEARPQPAPATQAA